MGLQIWWIPRGPRVSVTPLASTYTEMHMSFISFSFQMYKEGNPSAVADFQGALYF